MSIKPQFEESAGAAAQAARSAPSSEAPAPDPNPATLSPSFASLFPPGVVAAELRGPGAASLLLPAEALAVASAVPKRVQEFAAGRLCARRALAELGIRDFALRMASDRRPIWPETVVGCITHTKGICAAVIAPRLRFLSLGLDTEIAGAVKADLWGSICGPEELAWISSLEPTSRAAAATLVFSAKEAFYKFQYPIARESLSFSDLQVIPREWGVACGSFAVAPTRPLRLFAELPREAALPLVGSYRFHEEFVSAGLCLLA